MPPAPLFPTSRAAAQRSNFTRRHEDREEHEETTDLFASFVPFVPSCEPILFFAPPREPVLPFARARDIPIFQ